MVFRKKTPLEAAAWAVVDCETSGLDPRRDRLLAVAAVEVRGDRVPIDAAFAAVVRQEAPSTEGNIVIHGIGREAQLAGREPEGVIADLASFVGDRVPAAFHAPFDEAVLRRAGFRAGRSWVDLARLAPALYPKEKARTLDEWLAAFSIPCPERHDALADAQATAFLLLVLLAEARRQGARTVEDVGALTRAGRWTG